MFDVTIADIRREARVPVGNQTTYVIKQRRMPKDALDKIIPTNMLTVHFVHLNEETTFLHFLCNVMARSKSKGPR